jgi:hypothetical protein
MKCLINNETKVSINFKEIRTDTENNVLILDEIIWLPGPLTDYTVSDVSVFSAPTEIAAKQVSPIVFKLLFTGPERVAIKNSTDPLVRDFSDLVADPRLNYVDLGLQSTKEALEYLAMIDILAPERVNEILLGKVR